MFEKIYPGKLLLFGEHIVNMGAQALAIPFTNFSGSWAYNNVVEKGLRLDSLLLYLEQQQNSFLDLIAFKEAIDKGLYFDSNIPIGYGAGSSGALTAAIYDQFCKEISTVFPPTDLSNLKTNLSLIENYFHGASSGIDQLICYLNQPVLLESKNKLTITKSASTQCLFLLDTQQRRVTGPLVKIFLEKVKDDYFRKRCEAELSVYNDNAIHAYLSEQTNLLMEMVHEIAHFQFRYLPELIPDSFKDVWLKGLSSDLYKLKLCGAGGGGFLLGFTLNFESTQLQLKDYQLLRL